MKRLMRLVTVMIMAGTAFHPIVTKAGGQSPGSAAARAPVAVSLHGSIVLFRADGTGKTIVTGLHRDYAPVVAPNGMAVAFWRGTALSSRGPGLRTVMVARPNGGGGWRVAPFSRQPASAAGWQSTLVWAPDGNALAWFDRSTVQYRRVGGPQQRVLSVDSTHTTFVGLAVSRDDSTVAASLSPTGEGIPRNLRVAVRPLSASRQHIITITFRPGVLTIPDKRGSTPQGDDLAYTSSQLAPPGHTLEFRTQLVGAGLQMTGIFLVPDTGGRAHLVQGNGHGLHGIPPFGYGMSDATHFEEAPNGRYIATDPTGGFYVAGQIGPFHPSAPKPAGCVLSQWTWLADSVHLAFVTMCTVPGSSPIRVQLTLSAVSILGGSPIVLYRTVASDPIVLELARAYRCVACG